MNSENNETLNSNHNETLNSNHNERKAAGTKRKQAETKEKEAGTKRKRKENRQSELDGDEVVHCVDIIDNSLSNRKHSSLNDVPTTSLDPLKTIEDSDQDTDFQDEIIYEIDYIDGEDFSIPL